MIHDLICRLGYLSCHDLGKFYVVCAVVKQTRFQKQSLLNGCTLDSFPGVSQEAEE
jgi:hypothetical protein